ncbi:MAG: hypothetical protein HOJ88_03530 [Proteobacteria bacterium]|nr:hypothetical protein [Pseudomonadota bacterium]
MRIKPMTSSKFAITVLVLAVLSGCAHYGAAQIVSTPSGAEVINLDDSTLLGVTPATVWWKDSGGSRKNVTVRFKKPGYKEKVTQFWLSMRHTSQAKALAEPQLIEVNIEESN